MITIPTEIEKRLPQRTTEFHPFATNFMSASSVGVSELSLLLKNPSTSSEVPIAGLGSEFKGFSNSSQLWLATFFTSDLEPVYSIVEMGSYWPISPECVDLIDKNSLSDRTSIVNGHYAKLGSLQSAATSAVSARLTNGYISATAAATQTAAITKKYTSLSNSLRSYTQTLKDFFKKPEDSGYGVKKQIALYTPIAYGTSSSVNLIGSKRTSELNLQPIVKTDLMIVSVFYQDLYPAKIALPYHAGKYPTM